MNKVIEQMIPITEKGWRRYSYSWEPPPIKGFKIMHVRAHVRHGAHVDEHWFYTRVDDQGRALRGVNARGRMEELGITQTNAPPEVLKVLPDNIGSYTSNLDNYTKKLPSEHLKPGRKTKERIVLQAVNMSSYIEPIWVPVYKSVEGSIIGWMDIRSARFVSQAQIEPGLPGVIRGDLKIIAFKSPDGIALQPKPIPVKASKKVAASNGPNKVRTHARVSTRTGTSNPGLIDAVLAALRSAPPTGWNAVEVGAQMARNGFLIKGDVQMVVGMALAARAGKLNFGIVRVSKGRYAIR